LQQPLPEPAEYFIDHLRDLQVRIRDELRRQQERSELEELSRVELARDGDTIYRIDVHAEELLFEFCREWSREMPFVLVAEGIEGSGARTFPDGSAAEEARFVLLVDPIDGTRSLMYNKRSAWSLAAVAPNLAAGCRLQDVQVAVQTELPTTRACLSDQLWAARGRGAQGETHNLITAARSVFTPRPSQATSLAHCFAAIAKFFPGGKQVATRVEEALFEELLGPPEDGNPLVFDDQYMSSGGQLYELAIGHDRFLADLRPIFHRAAGGADGRLCCHPYDVATELIAREAGVIVTDPRGEPLDSPLDIRANVAWIGYANERLRQQVEPILQRLLAELPAAAGTEAHGTS
jgi:fructose-1,6-bisphosphatase/inositol monophosphatase family enzyme